MQSERRVLGYDQQFAEAYDDIFSDAANNAAPVEFLAAAFAGADTLLELGAGTGRVALPLIDRGFRVIAVDDSAAMLQRLRAKSTGSDDTGDNAALDIRQADMAQLPATSEPTAYTACSVRCRAY